MRISIQQPEFLPWAGFLNKIANVDRVVVFDNVQFKKRYFENRCKIVIGGKIGWLTVPVQTKGKYHQTIKDVAIEESPGWGEKAFRTIEANYRRAPHWEAFAPFLEDVFVRSEWRWLVDLNLRGIEFFCSYLGIPFDYVRGKDLCDPNVAGSELILDTCLRMNATEYLSGRFGRDYLDEDAFREKEVKLIYQDFSHPPYAHFSGMEVENISFLDMGLNLGKDSIEYVGRKA